jgi:hypothetical protein
MELKGLQELQDQEVQQELKEPKGLKEVLEVQEPKVHKEIQDTLGLKERQVVLVVVEQQEDKELKVHKEL